MMHWKKANYYGNCQGIYEDGSIGRVVVRREKQAVFNPAIWLGFETVRINGERAVVGPPDSNGWRQVLPA